MIEARSCSSSGDDTSTEYDRIVRWIPATGTGNDLLAGPWSFKSLEFVGDSRRDLTLRYGWTEYGGLVRGNRYLSGFHALRFLMISGGDSCANV